MIDIIAQYLAHCLCILCMGACNLGIGMELRQLQYFVAVAETLSISKAAEQLFMTQSPLSRQIQKLEQDLGVLLFHRTGKQLALTLEGEVFLEEAQKIITATEFARQRMRGLASQNNKVLRIAYMPYVMLTVLPTFLEYFRQRQPNLKPEIKEFYTNEEALDALKRGEADLAFHYPPCNHKELVSEVVFREEVVAILPEDHPLANKPLLEATDFVNQRYIFPDEEVNPGLLERFYLFAKELGFAPQIVHRVGPHQARLSLVSLGEGITLDGESVHKLNISGVVIKRVQENIRAYASVAIAWRSNTPPVMLNELLKALKV